MSNPTILKDSGNATSSRASRVGRARSNAPASRPTGRSGRARAPARRSATRAGGKALTTSATCGPSSTGSSASAALGESLASRLRALCASAGSTVYVQTWRRKVTPSGRPYWAHTARAPTTRETACTGWPTPRASAGTERLDVILARLERYRRATGKSFSLPLAVQARAVSPLAGWPTPQGMDHLPPMEYARRLNHPSRPGRTVSGNLREVVTLAGWPTPQEDNANNAGGHKGTAFGDLPTTALTVAAWKTPNSSDGEGGAMEYRPGANAHYKLRDQARLISPWLTPCASEASAGNPGMAMQPMLGSQAKLAPASGQPQSRTSASTGNGAVLNPAFSRWLMGLPEGWCSAAILASRAMSTRRRKRG